MKRIAFWTNFPSWNPMSHFNFLTSLFPPLFSSEYTSGTWVFYVTGFTTTWPSWEKPWSLEPETWSWVQSWGVSGFDSNAWKRPYISWLYSESDVIRIRGQFDPFVSLSGKEHPLPLCAAQQGAFIATIRVCLGDRRLQMNLRLDVPFLFHESLTKVSCNPFSYTLNSHYQPVLRISVSFRIRQVVNLLLLRKFHGSVCVRQVLEMYLFLRNCFLVVGNTPAADSNVISPKRRLT